MFTVEIAVAKVAKYAVRESGDSVEVIERPRGGLSVVMVDGQRSGSSAKAISNTVVRKAVSLLAEGVRDGAVARAAHDYLRTQRGGQVSAELTILSVDLESRTLVISRNGRCPVFYFAGQGWAPLDEPAERVGAVTGVRPVITEVPISVGQAVIAFTDGFIHAGARRGATRDPLVVINEQAGSQAISAQRLADDLLALALDLDEGRPLDDITVVVLQVLPPSPGVGPEVRRMSVSFPVSSR